MIVKSRFWRFLEWLVIVTWMLQPLDDLAWNVPELSIKLYVIMI